MVLRHPVWLVPVGLLSLGLRPSEARVLPPLVLGRSVSPGLENGASQDRKEGASSSPWKRATTLRLGGGGQSCLVPGEKCRRGAWGLTVASGLRGGAAAVGDDTSEDEDSDESFGDDDDEDDFEDEDFGEAGFVGRLAQDWKKTPVITRTFFQISVGIAVLAAVLNDNQWPSFLLLDWQPAIFKLQLWRLFTPFFYLGPLGVNFMLTTHFSWTYMSQLEKLHYREPHTFVMLLAFGVGSLLLLTLATGADINSSFTLGHSLSCFLVMVWSRKFAGSRVNVLEMFELSTELLPYFFVAQTLMMEGVIPWVDLSGLLIGYAWETLSIKGMLKAPKPLVNLFRNNAFLRAEYARAGKDYGQEMPPLHDDDDDDEQEHVPEPTVDGAEAATTGDTEVEKDGQTNSGEDKVSAAVSAAALAERQQGSKKGSTAPSVDESAMADAGGGGETAAVQEDESGSSGEEESDSGDDEEEEGTDGSEETESGIEESEDGDERPDSEQETLEDEYDEDEELSGSFEDSEED